MPFGFLIALKIKSSVLFCVSLHGSHRRQLRRRERNSLGKQKPISICYTITAIDAIC